MFGIEKWIFEAFPKMPAPVRIFTYLVILALFIYLILIPRFVDGQIVRKETATGGLLPYRGTDLQLQVDGRPYKFKTNEDGWFSLPLIGRLPESLTIQVFHADKNMWFPITFSAATIWTSSSHQIVILDDKPFVVVADSGAGAGGGSLVAAALDWLAGPVHAQNLVLSPSVPALPDREKASIREDVVAFYAKVAGKPNTEINANTPFSDASRGGLAYTQRIQVVTAIEQKYKLTIPDEHWQAMNTVGQLIDYVEKRKQLAQSTGSSVSASDKRSWAQIQQSFPADTRPVYKR